MNNDRPKIRALEVFPVKDDFICLRDPQGFSDKMLVLSRAVLYICSLMDGTRTTAQIAEEYGKLAGGNATNADIEEIIRELDAAYFLENESYAQKRSEIVNAFRSSPVRPPSHAGGAYEAEEEALLSQLDAYFQDDGTGTEPEETNGSENGDGMTTGEVQAIIAPHIDLRRGGPSFAAGYREMALHTKATTFVILGISHMPTKHRYVFTRKDFSTPLGTLVVDGAFMDSLTSRIATDFFEDEFVHKQEHSIEFQVLFLQYLIKRGLLPHRSMRDIKIVPILCSGFQDLMLPADSTPEDSTPEDSTPAEKHSPIDKRVKHSPSDDGETSEFIDALSYAIDSYDAPVCLIAGVDLSHVGRRFGQEVTLSKEFTEWVETEDKKMLGPVIAGDAEAFWSGIREEQDKRNVCGVPAIYTLLKVLEKRPGSPGRLLHYDMAVDEQTQSVVSFFSGAFYD